jgi:hypothetical protein
MLQRSGRLGVCTRSSWRMWLRHPYSPCRETGCLKRQGAARLRRKRNSLLGPTESTRRSLEGPSLPTSCAKTSTAALEATAARFGHSLATQMAYRRLSPTRKRKAPPDDDSGEMLVSLRDDDVESTESNVREGGPDTNELIAAQALVDMSRRPSKEPRRVNVSQIRMA